jgi:flagellar hook-length control protein FliK
VPHFASEATTQAYKPALPNPVRAASSSDSASNSPFDSLIDDGTLAPASQPPQSPAVPPDKTAAQPDSAAQPPAKTKGAKAAQAKGDTKVQIAATKPDAAEAANTTEADTAAATDVTVTNGKVPGDGKTKADVNLVEQAKAGDSVKPACDGKSADGSAPAASAADPANGSTQAITPAVAVVVAPPSVALAQATPAAPAAVAQTVTAGQPAIIAGATPKAKATDPEIAQSDSGNPTDDSKLSTKPALKLQNDGKPRPVPGDTSDADKPAAVYVRDDAAAATNHAATEAPQPAATDVQAVTPKTFDGLMPQAALPPQPQDASPAPASQAASAPLTPQPPAVPLAGVAVEIAGMANAGKNRFEIRLDPPELGRIEVRLNIDRDGNTSARLIADRADTLDLLRRDPSGLERALQDAGLKTADNGLQFSLRDQTMGREQSNSPTPPVAQIVVNDSALPTIDATQSNYSRLAGLRGGIDIRV